jgi:hypothetical protein
MIFSENRYPHHALACAIPTAFSRRAGSNNVCVTPADSVCGLGERMVLNRSGLWIPGSPPTKSAVADLDLKVLISVTPEINGAPE